MVPTALSLSGDGGDELFFGYKRYERALRNWRWHSRMPGFLRHALARSAKTHGEASRTGGFAALAAEMGARGIGDVYRQRVMRWRDPEAVVPGARLPETFYDEPDPLRDKGTPADAMMLADFSVYLPEDLLCKVDRTSMAVRSSVSPSLRGSTVEGFASGSELRSTPCPGSHGVTGGRSPMSPGSMTIPFGIGIGIWWCSCCAVAFASGASSTAPTSIARPRVIRGECRETGDG